MDATSAFLPGFEDRAAEWRRARIALEGAYQVLAAEVRGVYECALQLEQGGQDATAD
jgi:hypothetical protein